jgi:hypothetical protein
MLCIVGLIGVEVNGCVELPIRVYKLEWGLPVVRLKKVAAGEWAYLE